MARTSEEVMAEMLSELPESYDKTEGSVVYDMLKPFANIVESVELSNDNILKNIAFDTATDEQKIILAKERANIERKAAGYASGNVYIVGEPGAQVPEGTLVGSETMTYSVKCTGALDENGHLTTEVECTTPGTAGNIPVGAIIDFPTTIEGLQTVTNLEAFDNGFDEESWSDFEERYYSKIRNPGTGCNAEQYRLWALEVEGVGNARVLPRTPARGSVTVCIIDTDKEGASAEVVTATYNHIEELKAPPADTVVVSATEKAIDISCSITKAAGDTTDYTSRIREKVREYLRKIAFEKDYVSYAMVMNAILTIEGILDVSNLTLNGSVQNVAVASTEVAVLGSVTVE